MSSLLPSSLSRPTIVAQGGEAAPAPMMVEVDLLPSWYPRLLRRRRRLHLQVVAAVVVEAAAVAVGQVVRRRASMPSACLAC